MPDFGRDTYVKLVGGQLHARADNWDPGSMKAEMTLMGRRAFNMVEPFMAWKPIWFENEMTVFNAGGIPQWPELSEEYSKWKASAYPGMPILRRTDEMYSSLTSDTQHTIFHARPRSLSVGTTSRHSPWHVGGRKERLHVVLLEDAFTELSRICMDYIVSGGGRLKIAAQGVRRRSFDPYAGGGEE
jgi:hypothetical protein